MAAGGGRFSQSSSLHKMKKRNAFWVTGLITVMLVLGIRLMKDDDSSMAELPVAYVVCADSDGQNNRVYVVRLLDGDLLAVSDSIDLLGKPTHLAYDPNYSRIYISSMRGQSLDYSPLTVLDVGRGEFEVLNRFEINFEASSPRTARESKKSNARANQGSLRNTRVRDAYYSFVSPNGKELYVAHAGLADSGYLMAVWEAETGAVLRLLPIGIRSFYSWSPDGNYVAEIWPSAQRQRVKDGNTVVEELPGGVSVLDTRTGKEAGLTYLENNKGMHPPWGRIDEPFIHFSRRNPGLVRVYDRDTGKILSRFDLHALTGLEYWRDPAILKKGRLIAATMTNFHKQGYIVLIDVLDGMEITRTKVGEQCTNPVVAYG